MVFSHCSTVIIVPAPYLWCVRCVWVSRYPWISAGSIECTCKLSPDRDTMPRHISCGQTDHKLWCPTNSRLRTLSDMNERQRSLYVSTNWVEQSTQKMFRNWCWCLLVYCVIERKGIHWNSLSQCDDLAIHWYANIQIHDFTSFQANLNHEYVLLCIHD